MNLKHSKEIFFLLGVVAVWFAGWLAISFTRSKTAYFTWVALSDPSTAENPAGWWFGLFISWVLFLSLGYGLYLYKRNILDQRQALENVKEAWEKETADLKAGIMNKEDVLKNLSAAAVNREFRVGAALASWDDASPNSDAEYVIEGKAVSCRQQLGVLQTIASILVLIGLVGNFFGLADAVNRLPELTRASAQQGAFPTTAPGESALKTQSTTSADGVTAYETKSGLASDPEIDAPPADGQEATDSLEKSIIGISEGLSVVVISSVMGIGGMTILLMFVACFKSIFNATVTEEVVLIGAEIGSLLRPPGGSGGGGLSEEAQEAILTLPGRVEKFDKAAGLVTETFGKSSGDLKAIAQSLDQLFRQELVEAKGAHESYQESLKEFTRVLLDERKTLEGLTSRTNSLCDGMTNLAKTVQAIAKSTEDSATTHQETQAKYENYLRLITELAEKRNNEFDRKLKADQKILESSFKELAERQRGLAEDLLKRSDESLKAIGESLAETATRTLDNFRESLSEKLSDRHQAEMKALETLLQTQQESLGKTSNEISKLSSESLEASKRSLEETSTRLWDVCDRITETQDTALKSVVAYWKGEIGRFSETSVASIDSGLQDFVDKVQAVRSESASNQGGSVEDLVPLLEDIRDSIERLSKLEAFGSLSEELSKLNGQEQLNEFKNLAEQVKAIKIPEELTLSKASIEDLQRPLLELATLPSTNGGGGGDSAALLAALSAQRDQKIELSENSESRLAETLARSMESSLRPLLAKWEAASSQGAASSGDPSWYCNLCGMTNGQHDKNCADCGTFREQAVKAERVHPHQPNLREVVTGLEEVLRRELGQLFKPLQDLAEQQRTLHAQAGGNDGWIAPVQELQAVTEQSLASLKQETTAALMTTNRTLERIAALQEEAAAGPDKELLETLRIVADRLNEQAEKDREKEKEQEVAPKSGGLFGLFRSKKTEEEAPK